MEKDGQEEEAGFQHQPHFVCVCVCVSPFRGCSTPTSFSHICVGGKNFFFFFFLSSFLLRLSFYLIFISTLRSCCCCCFCSHQLGSLSLLCLLFLPFAEGELLLSIHPSIVPRVTAHPHKKHVCDVISNDSLFWLRHLLCQCTERRTFGTRFSFFSHVMLALQLPL